MNNTGSANTPSQIIYTKSFKVDLSGANSSDEMGLKKPVFIHGDSTM